MKFYFLDSSAFSKLFIVEDGSLALRRYLAEVNEKQVLVCAIAKLEVSSSLGRRFFLQEITMEERDQSLALLHQVLNRIGQIDVDAALIEKAAQFVQQYRLRSLDALQLAAAVLLQQELAQFDQMTFVASDVRLLSAATAAHLDTWNPDDQTAPPVN